MLQCALDCIIAMDHNGCILEFNPAAERTFGYKHDAVIGKPLCETLILAAFRDKPYQGLKHSFMNQQIETTALRADGSEFPVELAVMTLKLGENPFFTIYLRDITQRKKAQIQLVQAEKMVSLGTLVAGVAHELNNPINFVTLNSCNLRNDLDEFKKFIFNIFSDEVPETMIIKFQEKFDRFAIALQSISEGCARITTIVQDLRNFSRLDEAEHKQVNIVDGIRTTLRLIEAQYRDVVLFHRHFHTEQEIVCNPAQLNQVFMHILSNACQAIQHKQFLTKDDSLGTIIICTAVKNSNMVITFKDSGCGMTEETKEKIFEPFFTTRSVGEGTGMGMSAAYGIIENHHGRIEVDSELNQGATVTIFLPLRGDIN